MVSSRRFFKYHAENVHVPVSQNHHISVHQPCNGKDGSHLGSSRLLRSIPTQHRRTVACFYILANKHKVSNKSSILIMHVSNWV